MLTKRETTNFDVLRYLVALQSAMFRPVDASSVAVFRILFGAIVSFSSLRFLTKGWVEELYLAPTTHLTYAGFEWVRPLPGPMMYLLVTGLAITGICMAVGYRSTLALSLFIVGFTYTELIDATLYLNHYWFVSLTATLLLVLPVHHCWAIDVWRQPTKQATHIPALAVWTLRAQLSVVYVFAGLAKLNGDWVLRAQPMQLWLTDRYETPLVGPLLAEPATAYIFSWAGIVFDCTIVGWLLWKRSRPFAYAFVVSFHIITGALFAIGIFPLLMMAATLIFFSPDWPKKIRRCLPANFIPNRKTHLNKPSEASAIHPWSIVFLVVFATAQTLIPLRHYFYDGNVRWTEQGYYGSWRVMLSEKVGHLIYVVTDRSSGEIWDVKPELLLADWQVAQVAIRPDLIVATAHLLKDHYQLQGLDVEVRAQTAVTLNAKPNQQIVDPTIDLTNVSRLTSGSSWIVQLQETP